MAVARVEDAIGPRGRAVTLSRISWALLAVGLVVAGGAIYHLTRGTTIWFDEWGWVLHRRSGSASSLLQPNNEHLSLVPVIIYKLLFATAGISDYGPYRAIVTVAHLACATVVFAYVRYRVGSLLGLLAAALILCLGPAWENFLWPFQMAWLISLGAGVGALLALDREDARGDVAACLLLAISLASSGLGLPFAIGIVVELVAGRWWGSRLSRRRWWIVTLPLVPYAAWWIAYQHTRSVSHNVYLVPRFVAESAASALSALAGLGGGFTPQGSDVFLNWGIPLLVAGLILVGWRLMRVSRVPLRLISLTVIALSFWVLTGFSRADEIAPYASRYLYVGGLLTLLIAAEVWRGLRPRWWVGALFTVATLGAAISNVGVLRDAAAFLRTEGQVTTADVRALQIGRSVVTPGYLARFMPGYPFVQVTDGGYLAAARSLGSPTSGPGGLLSLNEPARETADAELISMHSVAPAPLIGRPRLGPRPAVVSVSGGMYHGRTSCQAFVPGGSTVAGGGPAALALALPPGGALVQARGASIGLELRRFGAEFHPVGTVPAGHSAALRIGPDLSPAPWQVQLLPGASALICGLSPAGGA